MHWNSEGDYTRHGRRETFSFSFFLGASSGMAILQSQSDGVNTRSAILNRDGKRKSVYKEWNFCEFELGEMLGSVQPVWIGLEF